MNRKQRVCVIVGFLMLVAATLFPPWRSSMGFGRFSSSYGFLFNPPYSGDTIELSRLLVEWLLIALVTGGIFYSLKGPDSPKPETRPSSVIAGERNWRRLFWLSVALYVLIAALGITSYSLLRKVRRLEARIQNLKTIVGELPSPEPSYLATTLTPQEVLQADSQYHYTLDLWARWVVAERQHVNACVGHIRRMREELNKKD